MSAPYECVPIATGHKVNQVPDGLNARFGNSNNNCVNDNNWRFVDDPNNPLNPFNNPNDPRIVQVFLVPYGSFSGTGSGTVPVMRFATFYVTGYNGQGNKKDPCQPNGNNATSCGQPGGGGGGGSGHAEEASPGAICGHFITYVDQVNETGGSEDDCDFGGLDTCVAVLTR
jgi:hypothetical protein